MGIGQLSDTELILVVLSLFYLSECVCWLPAGARCLVTRWRRCWFREAAGFLQNERGGFVCGSPLPTGRTFLCPPPWLEALRAVERAAAASSGTDESSGEPPETEQSSDAKPAAAQAAASLEPALATDRFTRLLQHATSVAAARERLNQYEQSIALTGSLSFGLFLIVFGGGPLLYYTAEQPDLLRLAVFLGVAWLYWLLTGLCFFRSHRRLYPDANSERRKRLLMLMFSPAVAMRSRDLLARPLMAGFHPLTAAIVLCRPEELRRFAREELLKLRYPLTEEQPVPAVARGELSPEECRKRLVQRLEDSLAAEGIDPGELLAAPEQDPDGSSYCPRCRRQSVEPSGFCPDCVEIELVAFPPLEEADTGTASAETAAKPATVSGENESGRDSETPAASVAGEGSPAG